MWMHACNLLLRSLVYYPSIFSGNWFTVGVLPVAIFIIKEFGRLRQIKWQAMTWAQWKGIARDSRWLVTLYILIFVWAVIHTVYQDHQYLVGACQRIQKGSG